MKKLIFSTLLVIFRLFSLEASNIDTLQASQVAHNFVIMNQLDMDFGAQPILIPINAYNGDPIAWVFEGQRGGYVVVSANKLLDPVIAYHPVQKFPAGSLLHNLIRSDLQVRMAHSARLPQRKIQMAAQWQKYLEDTKITIVEYQQWPEEGTTPTGGWIATQWHQGAPYNMFTPIRLSDGQRSAVGCPATTMSQILNFHKQINGTRFNAFDRYYHNYQQNFWIDDDWETYKFLSFESLNEFLQTIEEKFAQSEPQPLSSEEMAALSLATGFACKTVYTPAISGTFGVTQAFDAYQRFGFHTAVLLEQDESDDYIRQKMISNIQQALPVHLAVVDPQEQSGHNMICDGYRDNGFFHLNMGWGGTLDAWYNLPQGIPYNLTVFEGIIADINLETPLFTVNFIIQNLGQPLAGANILIEETGQTLISDDEGRASFSLPAGGYSYSVTRNDNTLYQGVFTIEEEDITIEIMLDLTNIIQTDSGLKIFPNPFRNTINLVVPQGVQTINVINMQGQQVWHWNDPQETRDLQVQLQDLPKGTYVLAVVARTGEVHIIKIVKASDE